VGVQIPENTWPVQSRKETQSALHLRFIYFDKCMIAFSSSSSFSSTFIDVFTHYRYFFGSRAKVRRIFAKYLLQSIAKLMIRKSTLESLQQTKLDSWIVYIYINVFSFNTSRYSLNSFESSTVFIYFDLIIFRRQNFFKIYIINYNYIFFSIIHNKE